MHPMLASPGTLSDLDNPDYIFEIKLDGIRCVATITDRIKLTSKTNKNITDHFPDIVDQLSPLTGRDVDIVLDGEIVTKSDNPLIPISDFQRLQTRLQRIADLDAAIAAVPAEYIAFDLISYEGVNQTRLPWHTRRNRLVSIASPMRLPVTAWVDYTQARKLFDLYTKQGVEGFMAKHRTSPYVLGTRSKEWRKIKPMLETTAYVGGITHGTGRRKDWFGGLVLGAQRRSAPWNVLDFIGVVGSGLTDELMVRFHQDAGFLYRPTSPFLDTKIDNVKYWLEPEWVATVKYQEKTKDGRLRFPTLISLGLKKEINDSNNAPSD